MKNAQAILEGETKRGIGDFNERRIEFRGYGICSWWTIRNITDRGEETQSEVLAESETDATEVSILGGGHVAIPPGTEMQVSAVNKVQNARHGEGGVGFLQALSILWYIAVNNAKGEILKNGGFLGVQEQAASHIEETDKIGDLYRAYSENAPKSEN